MTDRDSTRLKLVEFYEAHNPQKLASVEETLDKYEGRYEELFSQLEKKYRVWPRPQGTGPTCFLDIDIDGTRCGRLLVQLFADKVPKAAENFRRLCAGNAGNSERCWGKKRHYKGSPFHRVIPGFVAQGGDFFRGDGTGGESAFAGTADADANGKFADESCMMAHDRRGLLSMANSGKNTNGSQFFITLSEVKHLNGKHIVFGTITSGLEVLDQIEKQPTSCDRPTVPIVIADCGEVSNCNPAIKPTEGNNDSFRELADLRNKLRAETGLAVVAESWARAAAATREAGAVVSEAREKWLQLTTTQLLVPAADRVSSKVTEDADVIGHSGSEVVYEGHPSEAHANRARAAFDAVDETGVGVVTMDKFESLLENLGEGFYGDELNTQFKLVDPENTGKLTRNAFIEYYIKLATGDLDDADGDKDDQDDVEEERENARAAFDAIDNAKNGYIDHDDFQKLIESLGTTYCEEVLCGTKRRLCSSDGKIQRAHFVEWYAGWVTGDDDDDELEDDNGAEVTDEAAIAATWHRLSSAKEGQWKCETCSVYNEATKKKCVACETPNPAAAMSQEDAAAPGAVAESMGSIGAGGFSFNAGPGGKDSQPMFTNTFATAGQSLQKHFTGGAFAFTPAARETDRKIGFTFGAASTLGADTTQATNSTHAAPSFSFGVLPGTAASTNTMGTRHQSKSPSGFVFSFGKPSDPQTPKSFGGASSVEATEPSTGSNIRAMATIGDPQNIDSGRHISTTSESDTTTVEEHVNCRAGAAFDEVDVERKGVVSIDNFDAILESVGEGFFGEEADKNREFVDPEHTGTFTRDAFLNFYMKLVQGKLRNSTDEEDDKAFEADLEEERENARAAFDAIDTAQSGLINHADFQKLIESLGTTYCEEEHSRMLKRLETKDKEIRRSDFVEWYAHWVTGDDDDDEGEGNDDDEVADEAALAAAWQRLSAPKQGQWRCPTCSVYNEAADRKCAACYTLNPGSTLSEKEQLNECEDPASASSLSNSSPCFIGTFDAVEKTKATNVLSHSNAELSTGVNVHAPLGTFAFAPVAAQGICGEGGFRFAAGVKLDSQLKHSTADGTLHPFGAFSASDISNDAEGSKSASRGMPGFVFSFGKPSDSSNPEDKIHSPENTTQHEFNIAAVASSSFGDTLGGDKD